MIDCVLSYHLNPLTCGIAKFNTYLAEQMGVPILKALDPCALNYRFPLLSIKTSEFSAEDIQALDRLLASIRPDQALHLFLHAFSFTEIELKMVRQAKVVYCGNSELMAQLHDVRQDLVEVWCPGTIWDEQRFSHTELSVFSFGMAHKVRTEHYRKLKALLDQTAKSYRVFLSTALHEGTSLDGAFTEAFEELHAIFGNRIYFLGYLSDTAVYNYLSESTFFAAFFDGGVRANNTTVNAAMKIGSVVITNTDEHSPSGFVHMDNVLDINQCQALPIDAHVLEQISARAQTTATQLLGWQPLVTKIREYEEKMS